MKSSTSDNALENTGMVYRPPGEADAAAIHGLAAGSGTLDLNSEYFYLMFCKEFYRTSQVAIAPGDKVAGMMLGFCPPRRPDTLFVWQIGSAPAFRRQGLGRRLILETLLRPENAGLIHLEATVTPSNAASEAMFASAARRLEAAIQRSPYFGADLFSGPGHEAEILLRIGPFGGIPARNAVAGDP